MRRILLLASLFAAIAAPGAGAQAPERVYRLAILSPNPTAINSLRSNMLPQLARLGFAEGRNLQVDFRSAEADALPQLASEIAASAPDAIFAVSNLSVDAALAATRTLPIVMFGQDPVGAGYAASLAQPGGQVTGVAILTADLDVKRLELLRDVMPGARRAAVLIHRLARDPALREKSMNALAESAGLALAFHYVSRREEYPAAFAAMRAAGTQMLVVSGNTHFVRDVAAITALAREARLATVCEWQEMAMAGCLLGYGPSLSELQRRSANYMAMLFKGAAPGTLPIEQPANFELGVNMRVARALGITIPEILLLRADEVTE